MSNEERELLASLFVMQGEKHLDVGDSKVLESFKLANDVAPNCPIVMYRQALAFAKQNQNAFCLRAASKVFEKVLEAKPNFFDARHGWANAQVLLGECISEMDPFHQALHLFSTTEGLADKVSSTKLAAFYRDWGVCWHSLGKLSGEAYDFRKSLEVFHKASKYGQNASQFWIDYGNSVMELSALVGKPEILLEAVELYWKAVKLAPHHSKGWMNLATSLQLIYQYQPQESYFTLADESFDQVAKLDPQNVELWIKWGQLYSFKGRITRDIDRLYESCKKFEIAEICEQNHPLIFSSWGEALMLIGAWTENLSCLQQSQQKIINSLEIQSDNSHVWCIYGNCLNELGKYFGDHSYFEHAAEKFRYGIKFDSRSYLLWHGLALAYFGIGQLNNSLELIEESTKCYIKAVRCGSPPSPQFWNDWGVTLIKLAHVTGEKRHLVSALKKFEMALHYVTDVQDMGLLDPEWLFNYGSALEFLGELEEEASHYEKAIQAMEKVLEIDPGYHLAHFNLGALYSNLGDFEADPEHFQSSMKHFETYLSIEVEDDFAWNEWGVTLLYFAELIKDPSRPDDAQKLYKDAESKLLHAIALGNTSALYHLACLYSLTGKVAASIHYLERSEQNHALPSIDELSKDEWLEGIRGTTHFRSFLSHLQRNR